MWTATKGGTAVTPLLNRFFGLAVMLLSTEWRGIFSPISFKFCRDFSIASIKHQKARDSKERVLQTAQHCGICERSFKVWSVSKTVCRGFKSYCPCHSYPHIGYRKTTVNFHCGFLFSIINPLDIRKNIPHQSPHIYFHLCYNI